MKSRSAWIWACRTVAVVAMALLVAYLWHAGLARASGIASVLTLLAAVTALAAPYLLPPDVSRGEQPSVQRASVEPAPPVVPAAPGDDLDRVALFDRARVPEPDSQRMHAHVPAGGIAARKQTWVAAVTAFADIEDPDFRRNILRQMGDRLNLGYAFSAPYRPVARDHVAEIIDRCWEFKDRDAALGALEAALISLRPDDGAADRLRRLCEGN